MAIILNRRRMVGIRLESPTGTFTQPDLTTSIDNTPMLRSAKMTTEPISVERPTLRLTLTPVGDIYPGKSLGTLEVTFELTSNTAFSGDATTSAERSNITRWISSSNFVQLTEVASTRGRKVTGVASGTGPLRHGETVTGTGISGDWFVVGDCFGDDGVIFVTEATGTYSGTTFTGTESGAVFNVPASPLGNICYSWYPNSNVNALVTNGLACASIALYDDGKLWLMKGSCSNLEFEFKHGDAVLVNATTRGIVVSYTDAALPAALDPHKVPPTFLGSRVIVRHPLDAPSAAQKYGWTAFTAAGGIEGSINEIRLRTGNEIVLHENSMDPNGVNFAIITGRAPEGSFNPDEVLESEFSFVSNFMAGKPLRLRTTVVGPPAGSFLHDDPSTFNNNAFDFIAPGIVISGLADADRDGINTWDGSFRLSGGNYTASVAQSETPGKDNELVIIHR